MSVFVRDQSLFGLLRAVAVSEYAMKPYNNEIKNHVHRHVSARQAALVTVSTAAFARDASIAFQFAA